MDSCKEAAILNVVRILNCVVPSSTVGRFPVWSKTMGLISPVTEALRHLYVVIEVWITWLLVQAAHAMVTSASLILSDSA